MGVHLRCRSLQPRLLTKAFGGDRLMVRRPALNAFAPVDGGSLRWMYGATTCSILPRGSHSFEGTSGGEIAFVAVKGFLDVRYVSRNGATCAEFSWQGFDDADETCGRGWATIGTDGRLLGHIFIHQGDDSGFTCERE